MAKTTVKGQEKVDRFLRDIKYAATSYVTIGLHEEAGTYPPNGDGISVTVAEVGLWNEFGTKNSPERSFMRSAIDEGQGQIEKWRMELMGKVMEGKMTLEQALNAMGFRIMTLIQNKIKSNVPPPNADSTLAAKKRHGVAPNTLIDTGLMLRSVTYKVVIK